MTNRRNVPATRRSGASWMPVGRLHISLLAVWVVLGIGGPSAGAQPVTVGDPLEEYARVLQLTGRLDGPSLMVRPVLDHHLFGDLDPETIHPWRERIAQYHILRTTGPLEYGVLDPQAGIHWNSFRPSGMNDGALWQGKGVTASASAGLYVRYRFVSAAFRPVYIATQNAAFEPWPWRLNPERSPYSYPYRIDIDLPQRLGPDSFTTFDWGQSYVRVDYKGVALGFSNENLWWGPGLRNAIIMSNNAPGFPHGFLGTSGPTRSPIGRFQAHWIWAKVEESCCFDFINDNDVRMLTGITIDLQPRWIPGLYVGGAQSLLIHATVHKRIDRDFLGVLNLPFLDVGRERELGTDDKMLSLFGRYVLPRGGLEVYGEWSRGDHTSSFRDVFITPDHARGYTVGFQKAFVLNPRLYSTFKAELTRLEAPREEGFRAADVKNSSYYYTHEGIKQGYTHEGQVIGAGIGPGGSSQYLAVDLYPSWGKVGLFGFRTVFDNDRYYTDGPRTPGGSRIWWSHEVEFGGGAQGLVFLYGFEAGASVTVGRMLNQYYIFKNDNTNVNVTFTLRRSITGYR